MNPPAPLNASSLLAPAEDRRVFQRFALNMLVFVRLPELPAPALGDSAAAPDPALHTLQAVSVKDLSMTGLFFYSPHAYPIGAELEVCLSLDGREFGTAGTVERRARINNGLCGYGLSFRQSRTSKELRLTLAAFLLHRDSAVRRA